MTFNELVTWALDNGIEVNFYKSSLTLLYIARFVQLEEPFIFKELAATTVEQLLSITEHNLRNIFADLNMKTRKKRCPPSN